MTIQGAACHVFNEFINELDKWSSLGFNRLELAKAFNSGELIKTIIEESFGTVNGKNDDLFTCEKLTKYMVDYHIERNDICSISSVEVKTYENGRQGWTSHHHECSI